MALITFLSQTYFLILKLSNYMFLWLFFSAEILQAIFEEVSILLCHFSKSWFRERIKI